MRISCARGLNTTQVERLEAERLRAPDVEYRSRSKRSACRERVISVADAPGAE